MSIRRKIVYAVSLLLICIVEGSPEDFLEHGVVYATVGQNLTLNCSVDDNELKVSQIQWEKTNNRKKEILVVHNPQFGTDGKLKSSFAPLQNKTSGQLYGATLSLYMLHMSDSGQYCCEIVTFPKGSIKDITNLSVDVQEEELSFTTVDAQLNYEIQIQCLKNMTGIMQSGMVLEWVVQGNGTEELIVTSNGTNKIDSNLPTYKGRYQLNSHYSLIVKSAKTVDHERVFICKIKSPYRHLKSSSRVKVFGQSTKPEIIFNYQYNNLHTLRMTGTCLIRNAFPKPKLTWYINGHLLQDKERGASIQSEVSRDVEGQYQVKTTLHLLINQSKGNQSLWCQSVFIHQNKTLQNQSETMIVLAYPDLSIEITQPTTFIKEGDDVQIQCKSSLPADQYVFWSSKNTSKIYSSKDGNLNLRQITRHQSDAYVCKPEWSNFDYFKERNITIPVLVNYIDIIQCDRSSPVEVEAYSHLQIKCFSHASESPEYMWIQNNYTVSNSSTLDFEKMTKEKTGIYKVIATIPGISLQSHAEIVVTLKKDGMTPSYSNSTTYPDVTQDTTNSTERSEETSRYTNTTSQTQETNWYESTSYSPDVTNEHAYTNSSDGEPSWDSSTISSTEGPLSYTETSSTSQYSEDFNTTDPIKNSTDTD
ncbi:T-cell surface protein tactile-like isoform X2 [Polyodon spathula]|uniref:T-cell surface protein tactile-like isoform X2 n=1 Tax=Polyodon spathula TaxID=7913 RepID=UPI001B7F0319|nr:T-cell surface protein tactile-like isoform X2 [Polyodon spathula]